MALILSNGFFCKDPIRKNYSGNTEEFFPIRWTVFWRLIAPAKAVHFTAPIRGIMTGFSSECILVKECVHLKKQEGFQNTAANTTAGQIDSIAMKTGRQFAWNTADSLSASRKPKESGNEVF